MSEIIHPEIPYSIERKGIIWEKSDHSDSIEYCVSEINCGKYRVYQYPDGGSKGQWFWGVRFDTLVESKYSPSVLDMHASGIVPTIEEAMDVCLEAKDKFIADIKNLSVALGLNDYTLGYLEGQAELSKRVMGVLT